jgi:hypothetical protein
MGAKAGSFNHGGHGVHGGNGEGCGKAADSRSGFQPLFVKRTKRQDAASTFNAKCATDIVRRYRGWAGGGLGETRPTRDMWHR